MNTTETINPTTGKLTPDMLPAPKVAAPAPISPICLWEIPEGATIDRVTTLNADTLDALTLVDTHTVVNGQRIGKTYHISGHKLYPVPIETAACPLCDGPVKERVRDGRSYMGSNMHTSHQAVCLVCGAFGVAQDRDDWKGIEAEAKRIFIHIQPGDFIKAKDTPVCCGIVLDFGFIKAGRKYLHGFKISLANGRVDFIEQNNAVFIAR